MLGVLSRAIRQGEKRHLDWKERSKLFPFADDMALYRKNTKKYIDATRANKFRKATGCKSYNKNQLYLFTLAMNNLKIKLRKQFNLK